MAGTDESHRTPNSIVNDNAKIFTEQKTLDQSHNVNKVGKSVFYGSLDVSPSGEKQDFMKIESDTDEESKFFHSCK